MRRKGLRHPLLGAVRAGLPGEWQLAAGSRVPGDAGCGAEELSGSCLVICSLPLIEHFLTTRTKHLKWHSWNWRDHYLGARRYKRQLKGWAELLSYQNKNREVLGPVPRHIQSPYRKILNTEEGKSQPKQRISYNLFSWLTVKMTLYFITQFSHTYILYMCPTERLKQNFIKQSTSLPHASDSDVTLMHFFFFFKCWGRPAAHNSKNMALIEEKEGREVVLSFSPTGQHQHTLSAGKSSSSILT